MSAALFSSSSRFESIRKTKRLKIPAEFGHSCSMIDDDVTLRLALRKDLRLLWGQFKKLSLAGFADFSVCWSDLDFSLIHYACTNKDLRAEFMQMLYDICFEDLLERDVSLLLYSLFHPRRPLQV